MRIENGKIKKESLEQFEKEFMFRNTLTKALESWFDLRLEDITEIFEEIGIRSQDYDIIFLGQGFMSDIIFLKVKTTNKEYNVEIYKGTGYKSQAYFKIIEDKKSKIFHVRRGVKVKQFK